jgi:uncharacterized protein involved in outer membrane biogenesis
MKTLLWIVGGVVALVVIVLVALPLILTGGRVAGWIEDAVARRTGRAATIDNPALSLFPALRFSAQRITVADGPGGSGEPMLALGPTEVEAGLWPLLTGRVEVRRLTVDGLTARLRVAADGTPNWEPDRPADAPPETEPPPPPAAGPGSWPDVRVGELRLSGIAGSYDDAASGQKVTLTDGTVEGSMPDPAVPAELTARAVVNGRPTALTVRVEEPRALMEARSTAVRADLQNPLVTAHAEVQGAPGGKAAGTLAVAIPDVPAIRAWLALPAGNAAPLKAVRFDGNVAFDGGAASLSPFTLKLDEATVAGSLTADRSGPRPKIAAEVRVSPLDLDRLLPPEPKKTAITRPPAGKPATVAAPPPSDAPLPWAELKRADLDLALALDGVTVRGDRFGPGRLTVRLTNGVLAADLGDTPAFGGSLAAKAAANADEATAALDATLTTLRLAPLAERLGVAKAKDLTLAGSVSLRGQGAAREAFARSLNGQGTVSLKGTGIAAGSKPVVFDRVAIDAALPGFDKPLTVKGEVAPGGQPLAVSAAIADPRAFAAGKPSALTFDIKGAPLTASFKGEAAADGSAKGKTTVQIASLSALASAFKLDLPPALPVKAVAVDANLLATPVSAALDDLTLNIDEAKATGSLSADWAGKKPAVKARLTVEPLNLDRFLPAPAPAQASAAKPGAAPAPKAASGGWSDQPIDVSALAAVDVDAVIATRGLTAGGVTAGPGTLTLTVKDSVLTFDAPGVPLFGGRTDTALKLDGKARPMALALRLNADKVRAESALAALAGTAVLRGATALALDVTASGNSQRALVSTLGGTAKVTFTNGTLRGINIAAILRDPLAAATGSLGNDARETDFAEFGGGFRIERGVARTDDLRMLAPLFRVTGAGTVDLPPRRLDLKLEPVLTASLEGQGGDFARSGIQIPVTVTGPFEAPAIRPDFSGVAAKAIQDPAKAAEAVRRLREGGSPADVLGSFLGRPAPAPAAPGAAQPSAPPKTAPAKPADVLREGLGKLLGR